MKRFTLVCVALTALILGAVWITGCEQSYKKKQSDKVEQVEQKVEQARQDEAKAAAEAPPVAAAPESTPVDDVECFGSEDPNAPVLSIEAKGAKFELRNNYRLVALERDPNKPVVLGVVTDLKSDIPKNVINVKWFYAQFAKAGVDAVLFNGDIAEDYESFKRLFTYMGEQGYLTLVIIGNRDNKDAFVKAFTEVQAKYPNLVNVNKVRTVDFGGATLLSLPGYYDPNYIHHRPGCEYGPVHVEQVAKLAAEAKSATVLISHGPPRGEGPTAIDHATEAGNVGDPRMTELIMKSGISFGVFGNIHEAGGKAVGRDFKTVLNQGAFYDALYLNPGPGDSDPWNMNDESISRGMAAVLTIKEGKGSYQVFRITPEEQAGAEGPSERALQEAAPLEPGTLKPGTPEMQRQQ